MATAAQIEIVRLNLNDEDATDYDFTDTQIEYYIDLKDNVNYATYQLAQILIGKLRKDTVKKNASGEESTEFVDLMTRIKLLEGIRTWYAAEYSADIGNGTGLYIATTKPTIAGGDV